MQNVDVSSEESVKDLLCFINEKFGHIDALINCAGYVDPEPIFSTTLENWEKTISINLTGTFLCVKYMGLLMKKQVVKL